MLELLVRPYRDLLDELYEREAPLAKLADESDLLLHVHGPSASGPTPRVSVVTRLLGQTRDHVTRLAKQLGGFATVRVPPALDMGLVGIASGSLYIGFATVEAGDEGALTREAVDQIATTSKLVAEDRSLDELVSRFDDPAARDMAVAAVRQMSPSGQLGITEVDILGKRIANAVSLTTQTRRHARMLMAQPPLPRTARESFIGTVREVDLDASRFEIRNVDGHPEDIRCAHELDEREVKQLIDQRVRVAGTAEYGANRIVRLLWVDELERLA
ncbi:MAG TPA: hypothetical protein VGM88_05135 [Kofleriaceae bacterium]|jgi:hypothetical protein